ncbi:hypothetical protein QBC43DRAFT_337787 [Cladorrhinum sp. PSN259]|nr:hypothetical protein QBC43DRAFT_337787 [Cladorrhinum sp. PSN259]
MSPHPPTKIDDKVDIAIEYLKELESNYHSHSQLLKKINERLSNIETAQQTADTKLAELRALVVAKQAENFLPLRKILIVFTVFYALSLGYVAYHSYSIGASRNKIDIQPLMAWDNHPPY